MRNPTSTDNSFVQQEHPVMVFCLWPMTIILQCTSQKVQQRTFKKEYNTLFEQQELGDTCILSGEVQTAASLRLMTVMLGHWCGMSVDRLCLR